MAVIKSRLQGHTADSMLQLLKNKIRITWVEDVDGLFIENAFYQDYSPFHKYLSGYKTDFLILYYRAFQLFLYVFAIIGLMEQMKNAGKPENDGMWLITLTDWSIYHKKEILSLLVCCFGIAAVDCR